MIRKVSGVHKGFLKANYPHLEFCKYEQLALLTTSIIAFVTPILKSLVVPVI